jgi:hypothetical protein
VHMVAATDPTEDLNYVDIFEWEVHDVRRPWFDIIGARTFEGCDRWFKN